MREDDEYDDDTDREWPHLRRLSPEDDAPGRSSSADERLSPGEHRNCCLTGLKLVRLASSKMNILPSALVAGDQRSAVPLEQRRAIAPEEITTPARRYDLSTNLSSISSPTRRLVNSTTYTTSLNATGAAPYRQVPFASRSARD